MQYHFVHMRWFDNKNRLSRDELIKKFMNAIQDKSSPKSIVFCPPDEIKVLSASGEEHTVFVENLWRDYSGGDESARATIDKYVSPLGPLFKDSKQQPSRDSIVPIVKDTEYLNYMNPPGAFATRHLAGDLWVVYAADLPDSTIALKKTDIAKLGIQDSELHAIALENLRRILPEVEKYEGENYMLVTAGADYVPSLLLLDEIWPDFERSIRGQIVAAAPSRDVLLMGDSDSRIGVAQMREKARQIHEVGDHVVSQTLLVRRSGTWQVFDCL